jgi:hypothetical protein
MDYMIHYVKDHWDIVTKLHDAINDPEKMTDLLLEIDMRLNC